LTLIRTATTRTGSAHDHRKPDDEDVMRLPRYHDP
jgi:hypothetical protein